MLKSVNLEWFADRHALVVEIWDRTTQPETVRLEFTPDEWEQFTEAFRIFMLLTRLQAFRSVDHVLKKLEPPTTR